MYGFVLQDWVTIRCQTIASVAQSEPSWLPFSSFQDIVFWADVREVTNPTGGAANMTLAFETSPSKDDGLFQVMTGATITPITAAVAVKPVLVASNPAVPLATVTRPPPYEGR